MAHGVYLLIKHTDMYTVKTQTPKRKQHKIKNGKLTNTNIIGNRSMMIKIQSS